MLERNRHIEFLRYCLNEDRELPGCTKDMVWHDLLDFAKKQAIVGVMWQGMQRMDITTNKPTDDDVLEWMAAATKIARQNKTVNEKAIWVSDTFLHEGFRTCLLKGQGNALMYPDPLSRTPGDIDIYVEGGDKKVIEYVRTIRPISRAIYHHIDFIKAGKIPVEVHYRPQWLFQPFNNKKLQRWFERQGEEIFTHKVSLPEQKGTINVPTWRFNSIFQLAHVYKHVLDEGVGLRQIIDYYYLLKSEGIPSEDRKRQFKSDVQQMGMRRIAGAMMWLQHHVLGLDERFLPMEENEACGKAVLKEIIAGGNFGKYDERVMSGNYRSFFKSNVQRLWRDTRLIWFFPSECISEPFFRTYHYIWKWRHNRKKQ